MSSSFACFFFPPRKQPHQRPCTGSILMLAGLSGDLMEVCWDMLRQVSGFLFRSVVFVLKFVLFLTTFFFSYTSNFNFAIEDHIRACLDYGSMTGGMHQTHAALGASAQWWRHMMVTVEHLERTGVDIYLPRVSPFIYVYIWFSYVNTQLLVMTCRMTIPICFVATCSNPWNLWWKNPSRFFWWRTWRFLPFALRVLPWLMART